MAKPSQKVIRARRSVPELIRWLKELDSSTSAKCREAALVDGAIVERGLEDLLRYALPGLTKRKADALFSDRGVLGSFASKIQMADAIGLIGPQTRQDLEKVKEVRNIFAHSQRPITFRNKRIKQLCSHFHAPERDMPNEPTRSWTPFGRFKITIITLNFELSVRRDSKSDWRSP